MLHSALRHMLDDRAAGPQVAMRGQVQPEPQWHIIPALKPAGHNGRPVDKRRVAAARPRCIPLGRRRGKHCR